MRKKKEKKVEDYLRYTIINMSFGLIANAAAGAGPWKPYIGKVAYDIFGFIETCKMHSLIVDVYIDEQSYLNETGKSKDMSQTAE